MFTVSNKDFRTTLILFSDITVNFDFEHVAEIVAQCLYC